MNAPFPPAGGPASPGPGAGDEPELRSLLAAEARRQPPVSPDLRAGVDRRVRRHRLQRAGLVAPVVAVVLAGAVLLAPRSNPDATVATASEPTEQGGDVSTPDATTPDTTPEAVAPTPGTGTDCGTVELGPERLDPETAPLDCFIAAFNAGDDARLVVVMQGPDGGTLTETVTTAPGKQVTVTAAGSVSMQLPAMGLGSGGGLVPSESESAGQDCGTITVSEGTPPEQMDPQVVRCLLGLVTSGSGGGVTLVTNDATGATMTVRVDISASNLVTVSVDGTLTQTLPELEIPSDLTSHLPPNGIGIDELGLGGLGGSDFFPGAEKPGS